MVHELLLAAGAMPNNGMHPTADTAAVIFGHRPGRRVMPGVRSPERGGVITRMFHPAALRRSNSGMHPTADTSLVM
jgi:hypothetical protein